MPDAAKRPRQEAYRHRGGDLEDVVVQTRFGRHDELQQADRAANDEQEGEVDETGLEGKGRGGDACETKDNDTQPAVELFLGLHQRVQPLGALVGANDIVHHLLVHVVHVLELAQVDALRGPHDANLGRVRRPVVKGDDHASREIEELAVNLEDASRHAQVLLETVRGRAEEHERAAQLDDVALARQCLGNVHRDACFLLLVPQMAQPGRAAGSLMCRPLLPFGAACARIGRVGVGQPRGRLDEVGQRLL